MIPANQRTLFFALSLLCLIVLIAHICQYYFVTDDAFISFRYAKNFSEGFGLVFNEGERVEGYTNFLWVIILSGLKLIGLQPHHTAVPLSIFMTFLLLLQIVRLSHGIFDRKGVMLLIAPLFLILNRSFAVWSTGGLETRLFTLLIFSAILALQLYIINKSSRQLLYSSILFLLAALTRPEGILLFGLFYGWAILILTLKGKPVKKIILYSLIPATGIGLHFLFRLLYYGFLFPNTFYAKVTGLWPQMGLLYITQFVLEYGLVLMIIPMIFCVIHRKINRPRFQWYYIIIPSGPYFAYLILIGGDHFEFRQLDIFLPFLALYFQESIIRFYDYLKNHWQVWHKYILAAFLLMFTYAYIVPGWASHLNMPKTYDSGLAINSTDNNILSTLAPFTQYYALLDSIHKKQVEKFVGIRAEEHLMAMEQVFYPQAMLLKEAIDSGLIAGDETICLWCVGAIPYYSNLPTVDFLGLTDSAVAHQKTAATEKRLMAHEKRADWDYLMERKINYISTHPSRFFFDQDSLFHDGIFNTGKMKLYSYIIPFKDKFFIFNGSELPESLGPKIIERGREFYYLNSSGKIFHAEP